MKKAADPGLISANAPGGEATAQPPKGECSPSRHLAPELDPAEFFICKECQDQLRKRLTEPLRRLVDQLTGLRLHVTWHRPSHFNVSGKTPVLCPTARRRMDTNGQPPLDCEFCLERHWRLALPAAHRGRRFTGPCGLASFCACLRVNRICPLTLVLQTVVADEQGFCPAAEARSSPRRSALGNAGGWTPLPSLAKAGVISVTVADFNHAVALVRLILHDLEATIEARMARSGLDNALRRLKTTETEAARLHKELHQRLPQLPESGVCPAAGSHAQKIVQDMLDHVKRNQHRLIHLKELAAVMKMNASYLSALFSQTMGVTFHQFLDELRLARAKELLGDPRRRVCEVACAVGFANPNHFRNVFKAHEGVSPSEWRNLSHPIPSE